MEDEQEAAFTPDTRPPRTDRRHDEFFKVRCKKKKKNERFKVTSEVVRTAL